MISTNCGSLRKIASRHDSGRNRTVPRKDREGNCSMQAKDELYKSKGRINPCPRPDETIMVPGFVGKLKEIKQIL